MTFLAWMGVVGALLLLMALSSALLRRLPITTSAIYLAAGIGIGPVGLGWVEINFISSGVWIEHLTEVAVIVSLFVGGLKLRLPLSNSAWIAAYRLAGPVMVASILGVAAFSHYVIGISWPAAFLLGAVLAPTDPVLAGTVSVNDAADHDRMRYGLSGEAGFNDGAAFPFVIFGLMWMEYDHIASPAGMGSAGRAACRIFSRQWSGTPGNMAAGEIPGFRGPKRLPGNGPDSARVCRGRDHRGMGLSRRLRRRYRFQACGNQYGCRKSRCSKYRGCGR
jgi:hypothetical protein